MTDQQKAQACADAFAPLVAALDRIYDAFEQPNPHRRKVESKVITPPADSGITADGDQHESRSGHEQEAEGVER